jgi:hypothetical protein
MALSLRDVEQYADVSAQSRRLLQQAVAAGPHFTDGLAADRFLDLDELAQEAFGFSGATVPLALKKVARTFDGVAALRGVLGMPAPR